MTKQNRQQKETREFFYIFSNMQTMYSLRTIIRLTITTTIQLIHLFRIDFPFQIVSCLQISVGHIIVLHLYIVFFFIFKQFNYSNTKVILLLVRRTFRLPSFYILKLLTKQCTYLM